MRKLLVILAMMALPLAAPAKEPCDTVRMSLKVERTFIDVIESALKESDFSVMRTKMQSKVMVIIQNQQTKKFEEYLSDREDVIRTLTATIGKLSGKAMVYKKNRYDYVVQIESDELKHPLVMMFGMGDDDLVFKVLLY